MREIIIDAPTNIKIDIQNNHFSSCAHKEAKDSGKISQITKKAYSLFCQKAAPIGIVIDVSYADFARIYFGSGFNEPKTPIRDIMTEDAVYFLFAITLGHDVSNHISHLFRQGDALLGYLLNEICTIGIEDFADTITNQYKMRAVDQGRLNKDDVLLRYSPGYCGWHISGQQILHEHLQSCHIGITLTERFYMKPIKSISGVMIGGRASLHCFDDHYSFCSKCQVKRCRKR